MLTREQWENLARFAGVDENTRNYGWYPRSDWNDFGPLWVQLYRWRLTALTKRDWPATVYNAMTVFCMAEESGTEAELMEAGCQLGAAIGATMKPAIAADRETP